MKNTISIGQLANMTRSVKAKTNISKYADQLSTQCEKISIASSSILGNTLDKVNGVECLIQEVDGFVDTKLIRNKGVARITEELPGFEKLKTEIAPAFTSRLNTFTGLADAATSNLNEIITSPAIASIQANAQDVLGIAASAATLENLIPTINTSIISDLVSSGFSSITSNPLISIAKDFENSLGALDTNIEAALGSFKGGVLNRVITNTTNVFENEVTQLSKGLLSRAETVTVIQSILDDEPRDIITNLITNKVVEAFPLDNLGALQSAIYKIDPSLSNIINSQQNDVPNMGARSTQRINNSTIGNNWRNEKTPNDYKFTYVSSEEELISDFREPDRKINEVIVHWTGNYIDQGNIGAEDIHRWHLERGWNGIGYHYVIKRNGNLQRGRPINKIGTHTKNRNQSTVGISFVGGYNCTSGTKNPDRFMSAESFTPAQWKTFGTFIEAFYQVYPGGEVRGHTDIDTQRTDPGFDCESYVLNKFGKKNGKFTAIKSEEPTTPAASTVGKVYTDLPTLYHDVGAGDHPVGTIITFYDKDKHETAIANNKKFPGLRSTINPKDYEPVRMQVWGGQGLSNKQDGSYYAPAYIDDPKNNPAFGRHGPDTKRVHNLNLKENKFSSGYAHPSGSKKIYSTYRWVEDSFFT